MFSGEHAVSVFQCKVIASGLRLYAKTGMMPNRNYTPKNMMAMATQLTGIKFKARDYLGAADALNLLADKTAAEIKAGVHPESRIS
jgi:hypothetical protein